MIIFILLAILPCFVYLYKKYPKKDNSLVLMLGSGGHTAELLLLLKNFDFS